MPTASDNANVFAPIIRIYPAIAEPQKAKIVTEGIILPSLDEIRAALIPRDRISAERSDSVLWIQRIIRSRWLPPDLPMRLHGIRGSIMDQDAFIAEWRQSGRAFQVVITQKKMHVLTRKDAPGLVGITDRSELTQASLALANHLLALRTEPKPEDWTVQSVANLIYGNQYTSFARNWDETLLFVTDGLGHKFSVRKILNQLSPPERESFPPIVEPWFSTH